MATRRELISGLLALGATLPGRAQPPYDSGQAGILDLHHHILPPRYVSEIGSRPIGEPAGRNSAPEWTPAASLEAMDRIGIQTAVTSISAPGFSLNDTARTRRLVRACNEYARQLGGDHPGRFGSFAAMPLPDVEGAISEVAHAFDVLGADGVGILTSYGGVYPGDIHFAPFFDELQRRKAVVFVHPTPCACSAGVNVGVAPSAIEYPHETTRAITSLLTSGTFRRCPDVQFVFSHAGGTLPYIAGRIARQEPDAMATLKRLYYDVALSANPVTVGALMAFAGPRQVVFGSDFPFASADAVRGAATALADLVPDEGLRRRVERENAASILPRLRNNTR